MRFDVDAGLDLARPFFSISPLTPPDEFVFDVAIWAHDRLIAAEFEYSAMRLDRDPSRLTAYDTELILLETYHAGVTEGVIGDERTKVSAGVVHLVDWSRRHTSIMQGATGLGILIPHRMIGYDPSVHPAYRAMSTGTGFGKLLAINLQLLVESMKAAPSTDTEDLQKALLALVRACLLGDGYELRDPLNDGGRQRTIKGFIARNLHQRDLGPAQICHALGISRATLYRIVGPGGVEAYIREARLERCLADLLGSSPERGVVGEVAARWGFLDARNFRRAFRTRFGVSPAECLASSVEDRPQIGVDIHPIHRLLRKY